MNNKEFKPNYEHFADIVSLSAGRVLENEREKGSTYSYGTFCTNLEHQIGSHFGINPETFFGQDNEEDNYKDFSHEVVKLFDRLRALKNQEISSEAYKEIYEEILSLMNKYHIEIISTEDYWEHWSNKDETKTI